MKDTKSSMYNSSTGKVRPGIVTMGQKPKKALNLSAFMVADMSTILRSGHSWRSLQEKESKTAKASVCAILGS